MPFVGYTDPIDCTEHNGLLRAKDHDTSTSKRQFIHSLHGIIGHGRTQRRRRIDIKRRNPHEVIRKRKNWHQHQCEETRKDSGPESGSQAHARRQTILKCQAT